ncbi:MAG: carbohydrate-binding protein [Thermoguttaceae bacterium]
MANRKPLVLNNGQLEQIQSGDGLDAGAYQLPASAGSPGQRLAMPDEGTYLAWVDAIEGLVWKGTWSDQTAYTVNDAVESGGSTYICTQAHTNQAPPNASYWGLLASKGDKGDTGVKGDKGDTGDTGASGVDATSLVNDYVGALAICTPVYVKTNGHVDKAKADASGTTEVFGLIADVSVAASGPGNVQFHGLVVATTAQWDAITGGSGGLTPGTVYFLSAATAGLLTSTAPATLGQFVSRVGKAISSTTLALNPEPSIKL